MARRESIHIAGFERGNPIPVAARIGPLLFSGSLTGRDARTGAMPESIDEQCENVFAVVRELMSAAGGTTGDILKMTFHLVDYRDRKALNREWLRHFPDPESRPVRQVIAAHLDGGAVIHCDLVAVIDQ